LAFVNNYKKLTKSYRIYSRISRKIYYKILT